MKLLVSSFPSSAWERTASKLCFVAPTSDQRRSSLPGCRSREAELRGLAFPSRAWEREPGGPHSTRSKGITSASMHVEKLVAVEQHQGGLRPGGPLGGGTLSPVRGRLAGELLLDNGG